MNRTRFYDQNFNEVTPTGDSFFSLTPWTSDLDAANHSITNLNSLGLDSSSVIMTNDLSGGIAFKNGASVVADFTTTGNLNVEQYITALGFATSFGTAYLDDGADGALIKDTDGNNLLQLPYLGSGPNEFFGDLSVDGSVGIGTTSQLRAFHLYHDAGSFDGDSSGKFLVESSSGSYGQFQIVNQYASEASCVFATDATVNSDGTLSSTSDAYIWAFGAGTYGVSGDKFTIGNNAFGGPMFYLDASADTFEIVPGVQLNVGGDITTAGSYWAQGSQGYTGDLTFASGDVLHVAGGLVTGLN